MKKLLLILLLFPFTASSKELTQSQKVGELAFQTANFIDMLQTIEIVEHSDKWYETNPILGNVGKIVGKFTRKFEN